MPLILEGIVTTENEDGSVNISPMGPIVDTSMTTLRLRPYRTSTTYRNLKRTGGGVFHVTDDVELLSRASVGDVVPAPVLQRYAPTGGWILSSACRWYAFTVEELDDESDRTDIHCAVTHRGRLRDFFGFNRAKHAVLEAAILATRTKFLPREQIHEEMKRLAPLVEKTAGEQERRAFDFLRRFIERQIGPPAQ